MGWINSLKSTKDQNSEEIEHLNSAMSIKEIDSDVRKILVKKIPGTGVMARQG